MFEFLSRRNLPSYFYNQFIPMFMVWIFALLLGWCKDISPMITSLSMTLLFFHSYFIHRAFHNLPEFINVHMNFHHNKEGNSDNVGWVFNLVIELITNIVFFVLFYLGQVMLNVHLVPSMFIFYYGCIYVLIHIVNYSIFHTSIEHVIHHKSIHKEGAYNYGPDLLDHLFETNRFAEFENYTAIIPNILIAFVSTYVLYCKNSGIIPLHRKNRR